MTAPADVRQSPYVMDGSLTKSAPPLVNAAVGPETPNLPTATDAPFQLNSARATGTPHAERPSGLPNPPRATGTPHAERPTGLPNPPRATGAPAMPRPSVPPMAPARPASAHESGLPTPQTAADTPATVQTDAPAPLAGQTARNLPAFSLSRPVDRVLPRALRSAADGNMYAIDPDFRTVLACLRRLNDPDRSDLEKLLFLAGRFFGGNTPPDPDRLFADFVAGGAPADADEPPLLDFEQDAGAIYASFRQQYRIDLLSERLHWLAFRALLAGLGEDTPVGARARLRALDENRVAPEDRARVRRMKEQVAIRPRVSRAEQALLRELDRRLAAGEDPADILTQLGEV